MKNKNDIAEEISERLSITKKDSLIIVNSMIDIIKEYIKDGNEVSFSEFGKFVKIETKSKNNNLCRKDNKQFKYYTVKFKPYRKFKVELDEEIK